LIVTDMSREELQVKMALQTLDVYKQFIAQPMGMEPEARCSVLIAAVIAHMANDMLLDDIKEVLKSHLTNLEDMP